MDDNVVYTILIVSSIASGLLVRWTNGANARRIVATVIGICMIVLPCGFDCLHPLVVTLGNCVLIKAVGPRKCHIASFIWCFGYLSFFRAAHYIGLPKPAPVTNAVQLFNALRMIGVAFEVHDASCMKKQERESEEEASLRKNHQLRPSTLDIILYSLCYIGLFTGPYYKYRTYHDMLHQDSRANIPLLQTAMGCIKQLPVIAAVYLVCTYFFSIEYVDSEEFPNNPFWYRLFYMVPMFQIFRTRLYVAWIGSELMCMTSGLGAYPVASKARCGDGPSDLKALEESKKLDPASLEYEYETIHNLSIYGCELASTTRDGLRSWNMTVQYWLAAYIHRRLPRNYGAMRVAITMAVSAFWHGIHPGYYLSFLTVPLILVAEDAMIAAFRRGSSSQTRMFDWACWFCKMRGFDYNCMGFLLLTLDSTLNYWRSIYFTVHIFVVAFIVIGFACKPRKQKTKKVE